jgi:hypothetical protein
MMASVDAFLIVSTKRDRGHIGPDTPNQSDPLLQGSLGKKLSRARCIYIVDTRPEAMRGCCYNVSTGVTAL